MPVGLEYKQNNDNIPPFLTFLKYTDEKEKSAQVVSKILRDVGTNKKLLDIGAGNADYLLLILKNLGNPCGLHYYLLEPSPDLVQILHTRYNDFPHDSHIKIINKTWEDYAPEIKFDYVLASHLYHIPLNDYEQSFSKMVIALAENGKLIFILRNVDDVHEFKKTFKPMLLNKGFTPKILDQAMPVFEKIAREQNLCVHRYESQSYLNIPFEENVADTKSIVEFFLNMDWNDIPAHIQTESLEFIKRKKGIFRQVDGIIVVTKNSS